VNPEQGKVRRGLARDDLFTVVHEQFQTDTGDFADILLPATTQLEHWDVHNGYGHFYVQVNPPAISSLAEAKPNTEVFRLLARELGFEPELFEVSDEDLIRVALTPKAGYGYPTKEAFDGVTLERSVAEGALRLNVPRDFAPFANGGFATPSEKCELYSPREAAAGRDPLPYYAPPHEDPQTKPDLAAKYPLQMVCPPAPPFLNSTFANMAAHKAAAGGPVVEINPRDASDRGISDGDPVSVFNGRGRFRAKAVVGETVSPGVVATFGTRWGRDTADGSNCNATTSTALTDLGGGATFFDNLVEVEKVS
jgi:anaerobic selenocysteine-containing dehydrogenase